MEKPGERAKLIYLHLDCIQSNSVVRQQAVRRHFTTANLTTVCSQGLQLISYCKKPQADVCSISTPRHLQKVTNVQIFNPMFSYIRYKSIHNMLTSLQLPLCDFHRLQANSLN